MKRFIYRLRLWWWGKLTEKTIDTMDAWGSWLVTEYEVLDCRGNVIGYWAYGNWDPNLPYHGNF